MNGEQDKPGLIGLAGGLVLGAVVWRLPLAGLPPEGQKCLAMNLCVICWWAAKAMPVGFSSLALLLGYTLLLDPALSPPALIFGLWTNPIIYMVIGGFLFAEAVQSTGLGRRAALGFARRWIRSYRGVIVSCYLLGFILSFIIPHPWPRSFLILSVMGFVVKAARLSEPWAANIGLAVFAGSVPTSMILLTGDSTLNPGVAGFAGVNLSWLWWLCYMGLPGVLAGAATCLIQLKLFGEPPEFNLDKGYIRGQVASLGPISREEISCIVILGFAIAAWMTDFLHHIHPGWISLGAALLLGLPFLKILNASSLAKVNMGTLFFLCAALAMGAVGRVTGMNAWLAALLIPRNVPQNPFLFALIACLVCMVIHMLLGSTLAVLGIAAPIIISFGESAGLPKLAAAMTAYTAVAAHWVLPFHHMNLLVGCGPGAGGYSDRDVLKLGLPQTFVTLAICILEVCWWSLIGLI
jgi:di/tricarboxylate transporter